MISSPGASGLDHERTFDADEAASINWMKFLEQAWSNLAKQWQDAVQVPTACRLDLSSIYLPTSQNDAKYDRIWLGQSFVGLSATKSEPVATTSAMTVNHSILRCAFMLSRTLRMLASCSKCSLVEFSSAMTRVARKWVCSHKTLANSRCSSSFVHFGEIKREHSC